jgi:hypothetical protein
MKYIFLKKKGKACIPIMTYKKLSRVRTKFPNSSAELKKYPLFNGHK